MRLAKAQITGKNWKMNEDTWQNLDIREQRDRELIRGYLNDAPEEFKNESRKLEWIILRWWAPENQTEKNLELLRIGEKNSLNRKQLWEDGIKLAPWILKRMEPNMEENSSSVFKIWELRWETPPRIVEILRDDEFKGWTNGDNNLTDLGERNLTDDNSFLRQTWRRIWE